MLISHPFGEYLQLQISAIVNDYSMVLLIALSMTLAIFAILPAIRQSRGYTHRIKLAIFWGVIAGLILGLLESAAFISSNRYLKYKMYNLVLQSAVSIVNEYLLVSLGTVLFVFIALLALRSLLNFIGLNRGASDKIISGILPSLLLLIVGGYRINKEYLPGFLELKSIAGNALWLLICLLLVWVLGWTVLKLSQIRFNFVRRIYRVRNLVVVLALVITLNVVSYFYSMSLGKGSPNLILISIDTLRADHLSSYGYERNTSPNIDEFAKDGVLFKNTIAQAPWTLPSHMSLFTGLYSSSHGVILPTDKLSNGYLTLAEVLRNFGYYTVAFTDSGYLNHKYGYQGFDRFDDQGSSSGDIEKTYSKAVNWLRRGHSKPFFLFLHTYQTHCPYDPPPDYDIYSDKNYQGIVEVQGNCGAYYISIQPQLTTEDHQHIIDKYDGDIYYTDYFIGKLFDELKKLEIYDNSIIILTSDHGENFLDHSAYSIGHNELYDEVIKVPLIVKASEFPKGKVIDAQVESIDIMPTVLGLLKIPIPNRQDGESLVGLVKKGSYDRVFAFSENGWKKEKTQAGFNYKMIRSNNEWKLLSRFDNGLESLELFDLVNDPEEQHSLFSKKPEIVRPLYESLHIWMDTQEEKSKLFSTEKIRIDDKLTEQLKALGYIN